MIRTSFNRRPVRRPALLACLALAAGLLIVGGPATSSAAGPPDGATSVAECTTVVQPNARSRPGQNGSDPNDLSQRQVVSAEAAVSQRLAAKGLSTNSRFALPKLTVDVRFHVITRDDGSGGVSTAAIRKQIDVLNAAFAGKTWAGSAPTVFRFVTKSIDYTRNTDWYNWSVDFDDDDAQAKAALHKGGRDDLNIYITGLEAYLGYAYYPWEASLVQDGVVMVNSSLPGGSFVPYDEGDTATHEVGHWLGLMHTFENGCTAPGDGVSDTPYQFDGQNIFYCNESDDTCLAPGKDPVHNFMSYGDDPCMDRFTPGQSLRMGLVWLAFRQ
jgi:Pregnancy-associated plasma protein-A